MKSGIRDKAEGTFHEMKGKVKEVAGKLSDNPKLRVAGSIESIAGKVQGKAGQIKQVFGK
ncbi:MAG: CsbD family protein [Desulfobacteraceae bacterium]|nr:CsbD family protein [Desulfobacteraceae bacterium]